MNKNTNILVVSTLLFIAISIWRQDYLATSLVILTALAWRFLPNTIADAELITASQRTIDTIDRLLDESHQQLQQHLILIQAENQQLQSLIQHASNGLIANQQQIDAMIKDQTVLIVKMAEQLNKADISTQIQKIKALNQRLSDEAKKAITSLQFDDVCSQLSRQILKRLNVIKELTALIGQLTDLRHNENETHDNEIKLLKVEASLAVLTEETSILQHQTVVQQNVKSGDIELF